MKRISLIGIMVVGFFLFLSHTTSAQTRIKFRRGAVQANVSGTLASYRSKRVYVIRVRSGQTFKTAQINVRPGPITISIHGPNGEDVGDSDASCNNRKEI